MKRLVIVGTQWGDEGKGKITDYLAQRADVVVRYQGGNNAGHTVIAEGKKHSLHLLPSGILNPKIDNVLANGMVINPKALLDEIDQLDHDFKLHISDRAHITMPYHIDIDRSQEIFKAGKRIGTTHKGIGPTYTDKYNRSGIRMGTFIDPKQFHDALKEQLHYKNKMLLELGESPYDFDTLYETYVGYAKRLSPYVKDTSTYLNEMIQKDKKILFEGAQGVMLCIDHGTYPYVTSSSPTAASVPINTGIAPWLLDGALGVAKAYTTRVGEGALPSEIDGPLAHEIRERGHEYGTTTGRPRRIGWLDLNVLRHTKQVSGISKLAITLLDVLTGIDPLYVVDYYELDGRRIDTLPAEAHQMARLKPHFITVKGWHEDITQVTSFDALPEAAQSYLKMIESAVGVKIAMFSVGPDRKQTIMIEDVL